MQKLKFEYRITAAYIIIGAIWIAFSDKILEYFVKDPVALTRIQTFKGWFYVLITAILFYLILKRHLIKLRNAEQKAKESDRLKSAFLQNISHEIRTPMNSIFGFSELIKENSFSETEKAEFLKMITQGSDQLLNIVNKILDISLIETGNSNINKQTVHLNDLLDEIYYSYKRLIKNTISFSVVKGLSDPESIILTDMIKLKQTINNLLTNSVKFTDSGYIKLGYSIVNDELEFYVEDTGIGIEAKFHDKIFEIFSKAETDNSRIYEGVGLGLAICKGNIDLMKGRIWMKSVPGSGSMFFFSIPYESVIKPEARDNNISKKRKELNEMTILVAEDDEPNFQYIRELLKGTGAEILHAANGKEAVEICQKNDKISLILIDIKMPVMNGYEAIKQIRKSHPDLPIVAQTAYALSNEMLKAFNAGSNDYISKPFSREQLLAIIAKYQ